MPCRDLTRYRQPQPGTAAVAARRTVERLLNSSAFAQRNARSVILDENRGWIDTNS
jgi:hypothetical protein